MASAADRVAAFLGALRELEKSETLETWRPVLGMLSPPNLKPLRIGLERAVIAASLPKGERKHG